MTPPSPAPPPGPPPPAAEPAVVHVGVLVFPGCVRSGAVVPHDVLAVANQLMQARAPAGRVRFEAHWVSARGQLRVNSGGMCFDAVAPDAFALDALVVPGVDHADAASLTGLLDGLAPEQALLRGFARGAGHLLFGCSGTCLAARAGLLDGRRATTSWWLARYCREHFPAMQLQPEEILLQDGRLVSAAGITSYFDLALWLVGHHGGEDLRQLAARMLVLDTRRAHQGPYVAAAVLDGQGPVVIERARQWLNQHLDQPWTVQALARHCATSERTLLRRFQAVLGASPVQYVQQLRMARAKALLESTALSLEDIAPRCGYQDVSTLRKVFKQQVGLTPRDYRTRFGLRR